jgi:hypothetical protein
MDKNTTKKANYNSFNPLAMQTLIEKYNVSSNFIRLSLRNERHSQKAIAIREDYKRLDMEVEKFIQKNSNQLNQ